MEKKKLIEMTESGGFIELPFCPYCGDLTSSIGEFLPCCGRENNIEPSEWIRLRPLTIVRKRKDLDTKDDPVIE